MLIVLKFIIIFGNKTKIGIK